ncbi:hypothetical protein MferCBS31731_001538 [Microsporum ferrugineum]
MAYQARPPPHYGPSPGPQYGSGPPPQQYQDHYQHQHPPPDRRLPYGPGGDRPMNYDDGYRTNGQVPYGRGGRGMYDGGYPPPQNRPPRGPPPTPQGYRGPPNGYNNRPPHGGGYGPAGPPRAQNKPPPVRQHTYQAAPVKPNSPELKSSFDNPFPSFPPRKRVNSMDLGLEKKMGALELSQNQKHRGAPPILRPHTSNSNRPPPSTYHSEPLPTLNPRRLPSESPPPLNVETHHAAHPQQDPRAAPPSRSATMPVNMSAGGPKPLYPGQRAWQDPGLSPPPLSPALRPDTHPVSSRPGTAVGVKPELVHPKHADLEPQVADKVDGEDELSYLNEDLLNDYYDNTEPNEPDMPNFGAMSDENVGSPHAETLIPFDKPKQDPGSISGQKPAYAPYKPSGGIAPMQSSPERQGPTNGYGNPLMDEYAPSPAYAHRGYGQHQHHPNNAYFGEQGGRPMTPAQRGGQGSGGGYPAQQYHQYGPPPPENGGRGQYDSRRPYSPQDMNYGGPVEDQYSGYQGPDSHQHHPPPAPFRPGLDQGPKPAPVRNYTSTPQPAPTPQPNQASPSSYGGETRRSSQPITIGELHIIQQTARSNPADHAKQLVLAKKLVEASIHLVDDNGRADAKTRAKNRERYVMEAYKITKKLVGAGYPPGMFYMADCYGSGQLGLEINPKEAFSLYQSAAKMGHAESAYRVAVCCEMGQEGGGGTRRDPLKSVQWYRRAAALGDPPAMYKMGMILLKGLLGQPKNPREALSWLKRAAERADEENPHALHELALLYENPQGIDSIIRDEDYARELLHQAGELGYKFSQHRLGAAYEYGLVGCPVDARQSIYWYTQAAAQGEHQSELSLSGWYLTGAEGILQQSDTEAYLWARKAAMAGLAKAEYAMGYFTEVGIGVPTNLDDAKRWYWKASSQNFLKARERLEDLRRGGARMQKTRVSRSAVNKNEGDCIIYLGVRYSADSAITTPTTDLTVKRYYTLPIIPMARTPVYFLSHGGPNIMYDHEHPAYTKLQEIGREITGRVKPQAVVVFSAHWQGGRDTILVNTSETTELIYEGSKEIAEKVIRFIQGAGMKAEGVTRGLDHGVWASFKCAFDPEDNPLSVPVVQVSLFDDEDPDEHYKLGEAISQLRDENIQIIVSGMAVHNLRDFRFTFGDPSPLDYTVSFDEALKEAVMTPPAERQKAMAELLLRHDARQAHPTFEHLLPIHIGAGAAGVDCGERLWTLKEGSMSWAQFRFGDAPA